MDQIGNVVLNEVYQNVTGSTQSSLEGKVFGGSGVLQIEKMILENL